MFELTIPAPVYPRSHASGALIWDTANIMNLKID